MRNGVINKDRAVTPAFTKQMSEEPPAVKSRVSVTWCIRLEHCDAFMYVIIV